MLRLFRYRDLIRYLVVRELTVRYKRSAIGFTWTMLQPLLNMLVLFAVFSSIFRFNVFNYPVYALTGIMFWNFFSQSILNSMTSLSTNAGLIQKVPVPKEVFPVSTVIAGGINLLLTLIPVFLVMAMTRHPFSPALLFLPVSIVIVMLFTLGAGLLLAPLSVFFSDIGEIVRVLLQIFFYLTPCFYPLEIVPDRFLPFVKYSPFRSVLEIFRDPIYLAKVPPITHLSLAVFVTVVALVVGIFVFRRTSARIDYFV